MSVIERLRRASELAPDELLRRIRTKLADEISEAHVAAKGEKVLLKTGEDWVIAGADAPVEAGKGKLALGGVEVRVEPLEEWRQIYRETWRLERDFFYDPNLHGLDLAAAEARYAPYVEGLAHRDDLNYLLTEMLGELSCGHVYVGGEPVGQVERFE